MGGGDPWLGAEGSSCNAEEKEGRSTQMTPVARPPRSVQARPCTRRSVVLFLRVPRLRTHKYATSVTQTYNRCERVRAYMDCLSSLGVLSHGCTVRFERIRSTCDCHPNRRRRSDIEERKFLRKKWYVFHILLRNMARSSKSVWILNIGSMDFKPSLNIGDIGM